MQKTVLKYSLILGLVITTLACVASNVSNVPSISTLDPNAINTSIAGTMAAARTRTAQAELLAITPTLTTTPTRLPSMTPFSTYTLAVVAPQITVAVNTNCRAGPGKQYAIVGGLLKGETARVVGRSKDSKYWIIANPDRPGKICWLWGGDAIVTGIAGMVPILTPPPTPKPTKKPEPTRTPIRRTPAPANFKASYSGKADCISSQWWVNIRLENTGGKIFRSISVIYLDTFSGMTFFSDWNDFIKIKDCSDIRTVDVLPPKATTVVSLPPFNYDPAGHELFVEITLCSQPGQTGKCATKVISFIP